MAKKPDGKPASVDRVSFTRPAAERIGKAVRQVEAGNRDLGPIEWGPRGGGGVAGKVFRVCTFTGAWGINTSKVVTFRNVTATPNTASATNLFLALPDRGSQPCGIAKDGTAWHLIAYAPVTAQTAVLTSVSLGTAGLEFTQLNIKIFETVSSSVITIVPVNESVVTSVSLTGGALEFTRRTVKVFAGATAAPISIGTTACP
jgi:hypothetical protein